VTQAAQRCAGRNLECFIFDGAGGSGWFGWGFRRFGELYLSEDNNPDDESQCNKTGQDCPGKKGGGYKHEAGENVKDICITLGWIPGLTEICGGYYAGKLAGEKARGG